MNIADLRKDYALRRLDESDVDADPFRQFHAWLAEALEAQVPEPTAMTLATADIAGRPSARVMLLKALDERGFVFNTNLRSRKGREAAENPWGCVVFPWHPVERQAIAAGRLERVEEAESDAYFATRPYGAKISAHVSRQSEPIGGRAELEAAHAELEARYPPESEVPRPPHWGGLRLVPETVEFWQGRPNRLHDRLRFRREGEGWAVERLAP
jgi:pyridoxamine 5'-phosphate oxidase